MYVQIYYALRTCGTYCRDVFHPKNDGIYFLGCTATKHSFIVSLAKHNRHIELANNTNKTRKNNTRQVQNNTRQYHKNSRHDQKIRDNTKRITPVVLRAKCFFQ